MLKRAIEFLEIGIEKLENGGGATGNAGAASNGRAGKK